MLYTTETSVCILIHVFFSLYRLELNKVWRESVEKNFEKSLDHRSLSFKQQDKRFYSAKNLLTDIKGGVTEAGVSADDLLKAPGVLLAIPPVLAPLLSEMTPSMFLAYDQSESGVLQDVYRIVCHAMEVGGVSTADKERITALWRDLLRVFFNMPVHFLYTNSASSSLSNGAIDSILGIDIDMLHPTTDIDEVPIDSASSWQSGMNVLTIFGSGKIIGFRQVDNTYQVQLRFGVGYLRPGAIIGAEELSSQALEVIGVNIDSTGAHYIDSIAVQSGRPSAVVGGSCNILNGNQMSYVFMRLHHTLFWRLANARKLAEEVQTQHNSADEEGTIYRLLMIIFEKYIFYFIIIIIF